MTDDIFFVAARPLYLKTKIDFFGNLQNDWSREC